MEDVTKDLSKDPEIRIAAGMLFTKDLHTDSLWSCPYNSYRWVIGGKEETGFKVNDPRTGAFLGPLPTFDEAAELVRKSLLEERNRIDAVLKSGSIGAEKESPESGEETDTVSPTDWSSASPQAFADEVNRRYKLEEGIVSVLCGILVMGQAFVDEQDDVVIANATTNTHWNIRYYDGHIIHLFQYILS